MRANLIIKLNNGYRYNRCTYIYIRAIVHDKLSIRDVLDDKLSKVNIRVDYGEF